MNWAMGPADVHSLERTLCARVFGLGAHLKKLYASCVRLS